MVEKFRHIADVTIMFNGYKINGQEETGDLYSAIDMVMDKIERQVKKYRGKLRKRKSTSKEPSLEYTMNVIAAESDDEEGMRVIETQSEFAKPMDVNEAVMQLDLIDHDFLVFTNSETQQINVIYRRKDGHYGLIQPEKS
jgi:putative sigma-54 modulation protein